MVTLCTIRLNNKKSDILPTQCIYVFFFSEQTAIVSLCVINWLDFITEMECAYCAVRAESLNNIWFIVVFKTLSGDTLSES